MLKRVNITISLLVVHISVVIYAQPETVNYPVRFSQYYNSYSMVNPASIGEINSINFTMGNKRMLGNYSKISTYYLTFDTKLSRYGNYNFSNSGPYSSVGVNLYNDSEGMYLNRTRIYAVYAWHSSIAPRIKFSAGFELGGMNYSVKGTPLAGDGSDFAPDGSVGIWIYNQRFKSGISYHQLFNSSIQPLEEVAYLKPFLNVSGQLYLIQEGPVNLSFATNISVPVSQDETYYDLTTITTYKKKLTVVLGLHNNNRMINSIEILDLFQTDNKLNLSLTYSYTLAASIIANNFFEVGLNYRIK